jgi:hypothetical protein
MGEDAAWQIVIKCLLHIGWQAFGIRIGVVRGESGRGALCTALPEIQPTAGGVSQRLLRILSASNEHGLDRDDKGV